MLDDVDIRMNVSDPDSIFLHLNSIGGSFESSLRSRVVLEDYSKKLFEFSTRFEAWKNDNLIGLVAVYCNRMDQKSAFITNVSVCPMWGGRGVATELISACKKYVRGLGFFRLELEVDCENSAAISFYEKNNFERISGGEVIKMQCSISGEVVI